MSGCPHCGTPATCVQVNTPLTRTVDAGGCIVIGITGVTCYVAGAGIAFSAPDPGTGCYTISATGGGAGGQCYSAGSNVIFGAPDALSGCIAISTSAYVAGSGITFSAPAPVTGNITVSASNSACYTAGSGVAFGTPDVNGCRPIGLSNATLPGVLASIAIYPVANGGGIQIGYSSTLAFLTADIRPGATFADELLLELTGSGAAVVTQPGGTGTPIDVAVNIPIPVVGGVTVSAPATVLMNPGDFVEWGAPGDVPVTTTTANRLLQATFSTKAPNGAPLAPRIYLEQEGPPATWTAITSVVAPSTSRHNEAQGVIMRPTLYIVLTAPGNYRVRARAFLDPAFVGTSTPAWVDGFVVWALTG